MENPANRDGTPTKNTGSDGKSETGSEKRKTEKKTPPVNRGRTFGATGTEKRG